MKWIAPVVTLVVGLLIGYWMPASGGASGTSPQAGPDGVPVAAQAGGKTDPVTDPAKSASLAAEAAAGVEAENGAITKEWLKSLEDLGGFEQFGALYGRVKNASPADFPALIDSLAGMWGTSLGWQAQSLIAARWAELDPDGLMAHIEQQPLNQRWGLSNALFSAWARTDPQAAFAAAKKITARHQQSAAVSAIAGVVAQSNPNRALEMIADFYGNSMEGQWAYRGVFTMWAKRDPEAARAAALAMEDGPAKTNALTGALSEWIQSEPLAALKWLDEMPADSTVYNSRRQVFNNLLNTDLDLAKEYVESISDPFDRREVLENFQFSNLGWSKDFEEIEGLVDWVGSVAKGQNYDQKVSELIRSMAEIDSDRAIQYVMEMSPGNARMNSLGTIASQLAQSDPAAALAFVDTLVYDDERERALNNMAWQLARNGVESVSQLIAQSENPQVQQQLSRRIADEWSAFNREAALSWAESLTDERARNDATQAVIKNWMQSDPSAAFAYIENTLDEDKRGSAYSAALNDWVRYDPEAAVKWLAQLPDSAESQRSNIYSNVTRSYVQHDPMAASEWIGTQEEGPDRDRSVQTLVQSISSTDPEAGFIWAVTVGDEQTRRDSLNQSVRQWVKTDPDAAYKAVKDAKIEAAEKEPLFKMIDDQKKK